jgi:hypothetical protein
MGQVDANRQEKDGGTYVEHSKSNGIDRTGIGFVRLHWLEQFSEPKPGSSDGHKLESERIGQRAYKHGFTSSVAIAIGFARSDCDTRF